MLSILIMVCLAPSDTDTLASDLLAVGSTVEAINLVVDHEGRGDMRGELLAICARESGGGRGCDGNLDPVSLHAGDAWAGRPALDRAIRRGWVDPDCYTADELDPAEWSTRGPFGMIAAYTLHRIAPEFGECAPPWILDWPGPAALAALRHAEACRVLRRCGKKLCRVDACTCADRARMWVGPGVWDARGFVQQQQAIAAQCEEQPPWWVAYVALAKVLAAPVLRLCALAEGGEA
jgi:hypothetical protein